jgi:hypothetical protein
MSFRGRKKGNYAQGARNAWATRNKQGWHRKTDQEKKSELIILANEKFRGTNLEVAVKALSHRYRSHAKERDVIKAYEKILKPKN